MQKYNVKRHGEGLIACVRILCATSAIAVLAGCGMKGGASFSDSGLENPARQPVLAEGFERLSPGGIAYQLLQKPQLTLVKGGGVNGSTGLRAAYVGVERGSQRMSRNFNLPRPGLEYTLNYDVSFDKDFQFVLGGKLHGLGPRRSITGGKPMKPGGWSARVSFTETEGLKTYTYHQNKNKKYGAKGEKIKDFQFDKDRFYAVSLHVRVNNPPEASNGFSRLYVNGELIERAENLQLRSKGGRSTEITKMMFSTFHGGHSPKNAPRDESGGYKTVYATFDNFAVYANERIRLLPGQ